MAITNQYPPGDEAPGDWPVSVVVFVLLRRTRQCVQTSANVIPGGQRCYSPGRPVQHVARLGQHSCIGSTTLCADVCISSVTGWQLKEGLRPIEVFVQTTAQRPRRWYLDRAAHSHAHHPAKC
jgi:hypothetical protein